MSELVFAATQMACDWNKDGNLDRAEQAVREAAGLGAQIILLQELFETPYFCKDEEEEHLLLARPAQNNPVLERFRHWRPSSRSYCPSVFSNVATTVFSTRWL